MCIEDLSLQPFKGASHCSPFSPLLGTASGLEDAENKEAFFLGSPVEIHHGFSPAQSMVTAAHRPSSRGGESRPPYLPVPGLFQAQAVPQLRCCPEEYKDQ